ncbi:peroxiredoxin [Pseudobacteroides cellulosolvens]|uniref:Peroxiredoxin n=2 Tax=Pseudobacteroides cellulosolvens TaxID=35825 RepID=A0A0L6JTP4_9FIRM|nr:peroxiredoxin [Pseudobacteroides cellulosolvens]KNY29196.1 Peroxiredoxin [Pseudobacteroides cellulosolvens ATCC 35603 = DSM 2933]
MMTDNEPLKIGMKAPDFSATTTFGPLKISDYEGKWLVFFSHPGDFTPVCTTEFIAFARYYPYFVQRNACLLGLSIDSNPSHLAWVYNIYQNTGIQIPFPIVADRDASVARLYGMIAPDLNKSETVRSVFIIDPKGIIRAILQYPSTNGRNIPEIIRLIDALQTTDKEKVVTPANWMPGQPVIVPYPKTYKELIERVQNPQGLMCIDWYLCFKDLQE